MKTNHRKLHNQLRGLGYIIYTCDCNEGAHVYQIEKLNPHEWHEYVVDTKNKTIELGADGNVGELVTKYYTDLGFKINS